MSDCEKIEKLLWERLEKDLSPEDSDFLQKHLSQCADCRRVEATIDSLRHSKAADRETIDNIDPESFEDAVFRKIKARESEQRIARVDRGYAFRLYFSMGLAAAIVAFIVLSLGDLDRYVIPTPSPIREQAAPARQYDTVHITLKPKETKGSPATDEYREKGMAEENENGNLKIIPPPAITSVPETSQSGMTISNILGGAARIQRPNYPPAELSLVPKQEDSIANRGLAGMEMSSSESGKDTGGKKTISPPTLGSMAVQSVQQVEPGLGSPVQGFAILPTPVTNPSPDSVSIDSMYMVDEAKPSLSQQMRAYLPQVIVDSGRVEGMNMPRAVLVTVDKLPVPTKIIPPEYPVWAMKNGISGEVWVKARVDKQGNVVKAEIVSSSISGYGFEESALEAALESKYRPAEANGIKIGIWVLYPVKYVFRKNG